MTLADFLLARVAEDEARVHSAFSRRRPLDWTDERVAADCRAKQLIVDLCVQAVGSGTADVARLGLDVLRILASAYVDHPDYQPE